MKNHLYEKEALISKHSAFFPLLPAIMSEVESSFFKHHLRNFHLELNFDAKIKETFLKI